MDTDPSVYDVASRFVDDTLSEHEHSADTCIASERYRALCQRVAEAAQRALEAECLAIREEISSASSQDETAETDK
jgi:hypothetical protein